MVGFGSNDIGLTNKFGAKSDSNGGIIKRYCCIGSLALSGVMTIYEAEGGNLDPNKKVPWKFTGTTTTQSSCVDIDCGDSSVSLEKVYKDAQQFVGPKCGDAVSSLCLEHGMDDTCNNPFPGATTRGGGGVNEKPGFNCGGGGKGYTFRWGGDDVTKKVRAHPSWGPSPPGSRMEKFVSTSFTIMMTQFRALRCCKDPKCPMSLPKVREITEKGSIPFGPSSAFHKKAPIGGNKGWNNMGPGGWTYENQEGPAAVAAFSVLMEKLLGQKTKFKKCCT
tara:strand:+ start:555 stop:1385 length:831 start_codon:yes stop_codon:yes gene_type:complete